MRINLDIHIGDWTDQERRMVEGIRDHVRDQELPWSLNLRESPDHTAIASPGRPPDGIIAPARRAVVLRDHIGTHRIPSVFVGVPRVETLSTSHVAPDDVAIGELAARYLHERGYRHVVVFGFWNDPPPSLLARREGLFARARALGMSTAALPRPQPDAGGELSPHEAEARIAASLRAQPKPLAIFFHQDRAAAWWVDSLARAGLAVGPEVGIIGVDDMVGLCESCTPTLTSIPLPFRHMGVLAAIEVQRLMSGGEGQTITVAPVTVSARGSTDVGGASHPILGRAEDWLRRHPGAALYDGPLLEALGVSRATFARLCRRHLACSPSAWQRRLRLEMAERLLLDGDEPESVIAERCGYPDVRCFRQAFARAHGLRPSRFRERSR